jgi:hypothetical protein
MWIALGDELEKIALAGGLGKLAVNLGVLKGGPLKMVPKAGVGATAKVYPALGATEKAVGPARPWAGARSRVQPGPAITPEI